MRSDLFKLPETPPSQPIDAGLGFSLCINEEWAKYVRALLVHLLDSRWELSKRDYAEQEVLRLLGKLNSEDNYGLLSCAPPTDPSTLVGEICQTYLPNSPRFEYELYNPFDPNARVPDGYSRAPMVNGRDYVTRFSDDAYNFGQVEDTDILVSPDAILNELFGNLLDVAGTFETLYGLADNGFPRVRFRFQGKGRLILYFINAPQGGMAYITMNGNPIPVNTIDLSSFNFVEVDSYASLVATLFRFRPGNIHKQELLEVISDSDGDHYLDITFLPYADLQRMLGFGGGLRKITFCQQLGGTIDDVGITKIEVRNGKIRTLSKALDWFADGAEIEEIELPQCDCQQSSGDCGCADCGCNETNNNDCGCGCPDDDCGCGCEGENLMAIKDIINRDGALYKVDCNGVETFLAYAVDDPTTYDPNEVLNQMRTAGAAVPDNSQLACVKATAIINDLRTTIEGIPAELPLSELADYLTGAFLGRGMHIDRMTKIMWKVGASYSDEFVTNFTNHFDLTFGDYAVSRWEQFTCELAQVLPVNPDFTEQQWKTTLKSINPPDYAMLDRWFLEWFYLIMPFDYWQNIATNAILSNGDCGCTSLFTSDSGTVDLSTYEPDVATDEWFIYPLTFEATSPVDDGSFWLGAKFEFPATSYGIWGVKFSIQNGGANTVVRRRNDASGNAQLWNDQSENLSNGVYWLIHADGFSALNAFGTRLTNPTYPDATDAPEIAAGTASAMQVDFSPDTGAENSVVYDVQLIGVKK